MPKTPHEPRLKPNIPPAADTGSASSGPSPPPPKRSRGFRKFILTVAFLASIGYAGGVYYSFLSDNFHDFFTEHVPFGEDAVGYFEERAFQRRFPSGAELPRTWPQTRGETKVTIGSRSGLSATVADTRSDLAGNGRHRSAVEDSKPEPTAKKEAAKTVDGPRAKDNPPPEPAKTAPKASAKESPPVAKESLPAATVAAIDHVHVAEGNEPVVQDLVKVLNNIITAVNASPEAGKLSAIMENAKDELRKVVQDVSLLKEQVAQEAEAKIQNSHAEFETGAKELVRRIEQEMREQELKWREEYETEREKLGQSYQQRLHAELDAARNLGDEKKKSALLEQEIALQKTFMNSVKESVENEREGRLSKLAELSGSVGELEKLTGEWNTVVDATLQTQYLQVALEAVRAKLRASDHPTPFVNELLALKEVSKDDEIVNAAIASIPPVAYQRGLPSSAHLIDRFRRVAGEVRKASLLPEDAGVASHAASAVLSRLMFKKKSERGLPHGDDVEATLARTEVLLEEGNIDAAAREMNTLKGWAGVLSRDWVSECRRVLETQQAIEVRYQ